jgi:hypothetical protein
MPRKATKTPAKASRKAPQKRSAPKAPKAPARARKASSDAPRASGKGTLSQRREAAMSRAILEGRAAGLSEAQIGENVRAAAESIKD